MLARIDADAFDLAVGAWLADRLRLPTRRCRCRRAIAVDGAPAANLVCEHTKRLAHLASSSPPQTGACRASGSSSPGLVEAVGSVLPGAAWQRLVHAIRGW